MIDSVIGVLLMSRRGRKWRETDRVQKAALLALLLVAAWSWPGLIGAEEFRVNTGAELVTALAEADNNGENDVIVLAAGTYSGNFEYVPRDGLAVRLHGEQGTKSADVILDGGGSGTVVALRPSTVGGTVRLENLTIQGGAYAGLSIGYAEGNIVVFLTHVVVQDNLSGGHGGGILIRPYGNGTVKVEIQDSVIRRNRASNRGGGIYASARFGNRSVNLLLVNVLVYGNQAEWSGGGLQLSASEVGDDNELRAVVIHSTITGNVCDTSRAGFEKGGGIRVWANDGTGAQATLDLYNTILYGNHAVGGDEDQDLYIFEKSPGEAVVNVYSSDVGVATLGGGLPTYNETEVISTEPAFFDIAADNYHLMVSSLCRDAGTVAIPDPPGLPQHDFDGQRRLIGRAPDMGADEYTVVGVHIPLLLYD
ncbi:MAG: hypothetical protein JRJ29_22865 [Deltaproteobacteria bacterium]|nr:hypothetical protein [Deltaproteobacteria bacterium]